MSDTSATANGATLPVCLVTFPRQGVWTADLQIDADDAAPFAAGITIEAGDAGRFVGTPVPNGINVFNGRVYARIVGGKGGFPKPCAPKFYRSIPANIPLADCLADGGETLASSSQASQQIPFWTRPGTSIGEAFEELTDNLGLVWRVLDDGTTWVGAETWPEAVLPPEALILTENAAERTATLSDASALRPGMMYQGRFVGRVVLDLGAEATRTQAWFQERDAEGDVMRAALKKVVRQMTRTIDFLAKIPSRVVSQNGDGTLELKPRNPRWPGLSRIPIRYGVPGVTAKVKPGSYVDVEFEHGDPSQPIATVWSQESVEQLTVKADRIVVDALDIEAQHGRPLARIGDLVNTICGVAGQAAVGQIITGNQTNRG